MNVLSLRVVPVERARRARIGFTLVEVLVATMLTLSSRCRKERKGFIWPEDA